MKNSMTMVAAIGVCGLFFIVMMYYGVAGDTPAGKPPRVAGAIKERVAFDEVDVEIVGSGQIRVAYTTGNYLQFDAERQNAEMKEVADAALERTSEEEEARIRTMNIRL